jgi:adenosylhomocysteine nucleosidase
MNNKTVNYAIFSAMPEELDFFREHFSNCPLQKIRMYDFNLDIYEYNNSKILVSYTGLGTTFAASLMTLVHHCFRPSYILLLGTAGGIDPKLKLRDVIIAEKAFEAEIQEAFTALKGTPFESCLTHPLNNKQLPKQYSADKELLQIASDIDSLHTIYKGSVISSNSFPAPKELFERIKSESPYSIDMETSAFYQIGWLLNARVLAIRGISNLLNSDGTDDNVHLCDVKGSAAAAATIALKLLDVLILKYQLNSFNHFEIANVECEINEIIKNLNLQPHPEGGYYTRTL